MDRIARLESERRRNRRELDKLRHRGAIGRNAGATFAAIDRRLARDLELTRQLADLEDASRDNCWRCQGRGYVPAGGNEMRDCPRCTA